MSNSMNTTSTSLGSSVSRQSSAKSLFVPATAPLTKRSPLALKLSWPRNSRSKVGHQLWA